MIEPTLATEPARRVRAPLGIRELFFWPFLAVLVGAVIVKMARVNLPAIVYECAFSLGWLGLALFVARRRGWEPSRLFRPPQLRSDWALVLIVFLVLVAGVSSVFLTLYGLSLLAPDVIAEVLADDEPEIPLSAWARAIEIFRDIVAAPVSEEVVFRGVLLPLWAKRWNVRTAVLGTSVLFAAFHPLEPVNAFLFAVTMSVLYMRTGSLLVPIAAHALNNTVVLLADLGEEGGPDTLASFREDVVWAAPAFVASLAVLLVILRRAGPRPWRLPEAPSPLEPAASSSAPRPALREPVDKVDSTQSRE